MCASFGFGVLAMPKSLAKLIANAPPLFAPGVSHKRVGGWLDEIADTPAGPTLKRLLADYPTVGVLLAALAEGAPYLWDLARLEPRRLRADLHP